MFTLGTHFDKLVENIRPPQERIKAAKELPPQVRDYLKDSKDFPTVAPHTHLVGSYAQKLAVGDVKDVDFLVRVSGDPEANDPEAKQLIQSLKTALDGLPNALGLEGEAEMDIERARRSVHVHFKERDFHLDVVPCIAPDGFDQKLFVPDRGFNKWIPSHPVGYVKLLDDLNGEHGHKVKPLIRLLKHFRNVQMKSRRPKSYWLGALVVHHVSKDAGLDTSQPLAVLFRDLLDAIYNQYASLLGRDDGGTPNIKDPMLGHNVSWNWSRSHFETFMRRIDDGRRWASKGLEAEDRKTAIEWWQRVFGEEYFPGEIEEEALRLAAAALPGSAYVTSSGIVVASRPESGSHTPTRKTTFHGQETE